MPFYEYTCRSCEHSFSALRPISERDEPILCPKCGEGEVARNITTFSAIGAARAETCPEASTCSSSGFG
jgi:putative FmdB family regulatory protein